MIVPKAHANPQNGRIVATTVVTACLEESVAFYRDLLGYSLLGEDRWTQVSHALAGAELLTGRFALLTSAGSARDCVIRLVEIPSGAPANRPRPKARAWDPGLAIMECLCEDVAESYRTLRNAKIPMISSPRYYSFRNIGPRRELDVMSYSPFGPAGEQLFITADVRNDRPDWSIAGLHDNIHSVVVLSLDQRPIDKFYAETLRFERTSQMDCNQRNVDELTGSPQNNYFLWGFVGDGVNIEVEEHKQREGNVYPTSLNRTGFAMITIEVDDILDCRNRADVGGHLCASGALPLRNKISKDGFIMRGAVGELIEVIGR